MEGEHHYTLIHHTPIFGQVRLMIMTTISQQTCYFDSRFFFLPAHIYF